MTVIEARGLGCAQAQRIADEIRAEIGGYGPFISYLGKPRTPAEQRQINRAIAEWADGDSVAAHDAYGIDIFCSEDFGKSAANPSVLDAANGDWLTKTLGIQFATLGELAQCLCDERSGFLNFFTVENPMRCVSQCQTFPASSRSSTSGGLRRACPALRVTARPTDRQ